ncbi:MAG: BamA/TamA family outer membrane protein [Rhizomicrobium sp.]
MKPTRGIAFSLSQDLAGFGGSLKYLRTEEQFTAYKKILWDQFVGSLAINSGYISGYGGSLLPINDRFFKGGDTFRGFNIAGIGPRDLSVAKDLSALGGDVYVIGTAQVRLPSFLPEDYGVNFSLFSDFGTLGRNRQQATTLHDLRSLRHQRQSRYPCIGRCLDRLEIPVRSHPGRFGDAFPENIV